jgi:GH24 family phage-related lysozyme (muramidase)
VLSDLGMRFVARREACVLSAYPDPVVLSIGFGVQLLTLTLGDTITVPEAFALFRKAIKPRVADLNRWLKVQLEPHEFAALFSMYYQSGTKFLINENIITMINSGHAAAALARFPEFDTAKDADGNQVHVPNIKRRRIMEQKLYLTGDYGKLSPIPIWRNGYPGPLEWYDVQPGDFS